MRAGILLALAIVPRLAHADGDPVARLAPVWTDPIRIGTLAVDRGQLFGMTDDTHDLRAYDLADGYMNIPVDQIGTSPIAVAVAGSRIVTAMRDTIVAWKRMPLDDQPSALWRFDPGSVVEELAVDGERVYVSVVDAATPPRRAVIALALATGKQAWRLDLPTNAEPELLAAELGARGVVVGNIRGTETDAGPRMFALGFDRATGAQAWQYTGAPSRALATNHRSLIIARTDELTVVDRFTGHAFDTPLPVVLDPKLAVTDDVAVLAGPADDAGYIVAVDLPSRRARIVTQTPVMKNTPVAIGGPVVFIESPGGILRAFDRFTGVQRWQWSIGSDVVLRADGDRLIATTDSAITVFAPGMPPPLEHAAIHGKAEVECRDQAPLAILVGETPVTTAADGTYVVRVHARGAVGIRFADTVELGGGAVVVPLTGRTRYHAPTLQTSVCSGD